MQDNIDAIALENSIGETFQCPMRIRVSPEKLNAFLELSESENHSLFNGGEESIVVPANLLLSIIPSMLQSGLTVQRFDNANTVSYREVRFVQTVNSNQELSLRYTISDVRRLADNYFVELQLEMMDARTGEQLLTLVQTDRFHNSWAD